MVWVFDDGHQFFILGQRDEDEAVGIWEQVSAMREGLI